MKKDKQKVLDEVWTDERIKSFLDLTPPQGVNADFHCLMTAYKSMRLDDFATFIGYFREAGRDTAAANDAGETASDIIKRHRYGKEYADILAG